VCRLPVLSSHRTKADGKWSVYILGGACRYSVPETGQENGCSVQNMDINVEVMFMSVKILKTISMDRPTDSRYQYHFSSRNGY